MSKNKKAILITLIIVVILFFLIQSVYKKIINGNNITKSSDDLIEYIFNISSYEAKLEVTINSNKTTNKYVLEQYYMSPNYSRQIIKEPKNIENVEIIFNGNNLEVRNTNLGLIKIYEKYQYLNKNLLWLNFYLENYKKKYDLEENGEEIILKGNIEENNYKTILYISKKTQFPVRIEVLDTNNQNKIYIEYTEIKLNNIQENNIFTLKTEDIKKEV